MTASASGLLRQRLITGLVYRKTLVIWDVRRGKGFGTREGQENSECIVVGEKPLSTDRTQVVSSIIERKSISVAIASLTESRLKCNHPSNFWHDVIYAKSAGFKTRESTFNLYDNLLRIPQSIIMTNFFRWLRFYGFECEFRSTSTSKLFSKLHEAPWRGISFYFATLCSLRFHLLRDASRDPWSVVKASPLFHYCSRGMLTR